MALSPKQLEEYKANGFLLLDLLDLPSVDAAVAAVEALAGDAGTLGKVNPSNPRLAFDTSDNAGEQLLKMVEPVLDLSQPLSNLIKSEAIQSIFKSIFDDDTEPVLFEDKIHFKLPTSQQQQQQQRTFDDAGAFPWHQDFTFWSQYSPRLASLVIYLDDATELNGALQLRKHPIAEGPLPHVPANANFPLKLQDNDSASTISVGRRGTAVLFSCMTPHASLPNISDGPRRTLFVSYNPSSDGDGYNTVSTTPALYDVGSHNLGQLPCHKIDKWRAWRAAGEPTGDEHTGGKGLIFGGSM